MLGKVTEFLFSRMLSGLSLALINCGQHWEWNWVCLELPYAWYTLSIHPMSVPIVCETFKQSFCCTKAYVLQRCQNKKNKHQMLIKKKNRKKIKQVEFY